MTSREFARAIVDGLRHGRISSAVVTEFARCAAIVHAHDAFDFYRYSIKHLGRHSHRPGPKSNPDRDKRTRAAVHLARFDRASLGRDEAIRRAAAKYNLPENVVRNAYEGRVKKFRNPKKPK